jgi:hypothetical protein
MSARWTAASVAAAVFMVAFLSVQLLVPALALFGPRPTRFAWQMYSALPPVPRAWAVAADGTVREVDLEPLFAARRAEIDYQAVLREGLCDAVDAKAIRLQLHGDAAVEEIPCR